MTHIGTIKLDEAGPAIIFMVENASDLYVQVDAPGVAWGTAVLTLTQRAVPGHGGWHAFSSPVTFSAAGSSGKIDVRGVGEVKLAVTTASSTSGAEASVSMNAERHG